MVCGGYERKGLKTTRCVTLVASLLLVGACTSSGGSAKAGTNGDDTIVRVGGEAIPMSVYQSALDDAIAKAGPKSGPSVRRVVIRKLIRHTLLRQQAKAMGIPSAELTFEELGEKVGTAVAGEQLAGLEGEARIAKLKEVLNGLYGNADVDYVVPIEQLPTEPSR